MELNKHEFEPFYYNERVDVINSQKSTVLDAHIVSIRGNILVVKYSNTGEVQNIHIDDNIILKQWKPGRPFLRMNRIDVKSEETKLFYEAIIVDIEPKRILVKYQIKSKIYEEWIDKDSKRIAPVGKYSGKFDPNLHTAEEINNYLYRKKKFFKPSENSEDKFREDLKSIGLKIKEISGDGNCLYRAFCDQVYGNDLGFEIVKSKCLDYIELEKDFFGQFIEGGFEKFDDYIKMKKMNGVWGDDIEIQAMSEIYNRQIEIYSYSNKPIKTFHESHNVRVDFDRKRHNYIQLPAIKLSYHGKQHYNSIQPIDIKSYKDSILNQPVGLHEDKILDNIKNKQREKNLVEGKNNILFASSNDTSKNEVSRGFFIDQGLKDLDRLLEEKFNLKNQQTINEIIEKTEISQVVAESRKEFDEDEILNNTLKISKDIYNKEEDLTNNQGIKFIVEMGFTLEEAIMAFSAVGEDPDIMLQYLYSLNNYN